MQKTKYNKHFLYPGMLFASRMPYEVTTILGTCVAVCLWDSKQNIGGINHYLLAEWNKEHLPSPKYGDVALQRLLNKMISLGSNKIDLKAKIFGGADQWNSGNGKQLPIGERNALLAVKWAEENNIPILGQSLGKKSGRKIKFYTDTGDVLLKTLSPEK